MMGQSFATRNCNGIYLRKVRDQWILAEVNSLQNAGCGGGKRIEREREREKSGLGVKFFSS